jgi:hypothetical protein
MITVNGELPDPQCPYITEMHNAGFFDRQAGLYHFTGYNVYEIIKGRSDY